MAEGYGRLDVDHGYLAHQAAVRRLNALDDVLDAELEEYEQATASLDPPLLAPYCGCQDCVVREALTAAWPHLLAAAREELGQQDLAQT